MEWFKCYVCDEGFGTVEGVNRCHHEEKEWIMSKVLDRANDRIGLLTEYGVRKEIPLGPGYQMVWSNGSARWYRDRNPTLAGTTIQLDANEFFLPGTAEEIDAVIEQLDQLPLYANSFEARFGRGV